MQPNKVDKHGMCVAKKIGFCDRHVPVSEMLIHINSPRLSVSAEWEMKNVLLTNYKTITRSRQGLKASNFSEMVNLI
jgi:hypothetical protein